MITIQIGEHVANFDTVSWECPDKEMERALDRTIPRETYSPAEGRFDVAAAKAAIDFFGAGKVLGMSPTTSASVGADRSGNDQPVY